MTKKSSEPKFHHYVPRYYLSGFVEPVPKSSRIWIYEKSTGRCFASTPDNFGGTNDFYTIINPDGTKDRSVEDFLNLEIELPAKPALDKIRQSQLLEDDEKKALTRYLIFLLKRVPKTRENSRRNVIPEVAAKLRERIKREAIVGMIDHPDRAEWYQSLLKASEVYLPQWESRMTDRTEVDNMLVGQLRNDSVRSMAALYRMSWTFVTSRNGFITSDSPFVFDVRMGIGREYSQVTVPLSRDTALICDPPTGAPDCYREATTAEVKQINRRTISTAYQFVISPFKDAKWLQNLLQQPRIKFKRIRR